jgi:penicillin-binding protein 1C
MARDRRFLALAVGLAGLGLVLPPAVSRIAGSIGPHELEAVRKTSVVVLDRNDVLLRAFTTREGRWRLPVTAADVDPRFLAMLVAYEDKRFHGHHGVDFFALGRAALQFIAQGRIVSGGSTLSMQVARLTEPREQRSLTAKLAQIFRAIQLEREVGKAGVLDLYLRLAPYGGNLEGIRAASLAYFGKEPKRLSIAEAALLVALPQSPEARRPDLHPEAARRAREKVLERVAAAGVITEVERDAAKREPVPNVRRPFPLLAPHASEAALRRAPGVNHLGSARDAGGKPVSTFPHPALGVHRLTLDATLQASLESLAREAATRHGEKLSAAILVLDNESGEILAHVGAADYFSKARAGALDMTEAIRSPGSALKPFIYALAFESGIAHPETLLDDRRTRYGAYAPENFDHGFEGNVTARRALQASLNLPAVALLSEIGPAHFLARLANAGVLIALPDESVPGLAVGLGGAGISLRDLAALYAGLARGGDMPSLVETKDTPASMRDHRRLFEPVASWYVADILRGTPPPLNAPAGRIAFKTGTSYGYRDAFAVGFDKVHTVAVWLGRPDNGAGPGLVARQAAAPVLFDAFARLGPARDFPAPPAGRLVSRTATLPPPLRHLRKDTPKTFAAAIVAPLKIAFPPDGARIDLGLTTGSSDAGRPAASLALKAEGGVPPLTWIVNGEPVGTPDLRRRAAFVPDGAGFARVSVIDARGKTDSVVVRLE